MFTFKEFLIVMLMVAIIQFSLQVGFEKAYHVYTNNREFTKLEIGLRITGLISLMLFSILLLVY